MDISNCLLFFLSFLFSFLPFSTLRLSLPFNLRGRSWGINFIKYNASLMAWLGELNTIKCIWKLLPHCMTSVVTFWLFKKLYFHKLAAASAKVLPSCLTLRPYGLSPARLLCPWGSLGKSTGMSCHSLLQGTVLTQGSNLRLFCLLHWQAGSLPLGLPGKTSTSLIGPQSCYSV